MLSKDDDGFVAREVGDFAALERWLAERGDPRELLLVMATTEAVAVTRALFAHGYTTVSVTDDADGLHTLVVIPGRDLSDRMFASPSRKEE